jgi:hypothetical protein
VDNIVGMVPSGNGKGYLLFGSDGGTFAFGDAAFVGSLPGASVHVHDIVGATSPQSERTTTQNRNDECDHGIGTGATLVLGWTGGGRRR